MEKSIQFPLNGGHNTDDEKSKEFSSDSMSKNVNDSNDRKSLPIGTILEGTSYRIEAILGRGGFGITYKVFDIHLRETMALKEFFPDDYADRDVSVSLKLNASPNKTDAFNKLKARFFKEAQNLKNCTHPGIVRVHSVLTPSSTNTICYLMDYINGLTLREKFEGHPLCFEEARSLILKIAAPLQHMHKRNIIHFDLNPNNVMLRHDDGSVVIIDFGFSKQYDSSGNQKSSSLLVGGTKGYIAPELGTGRLKNFSPSPDIYALGGIFYFLLTGHNPVSYLELIQDDRLLLAEIPTKLHPFFKKAMAVQVKERFQSVEEFCKALLEIGHTDTKKTKQVPTSSNQNDVRVVRAHNLRGGYSSQTLGQKESIENFDEKRGPHGGFYEVRKGNKWNFLTSDGKILSKDWFEEIKEFENGLGQVKFNNKWFFIKADGTILSDVPFTYQRYVKNTLWTIVKSNGRWNLINSHGKLLSKEWFDATERQDNSTLLQRGWKWWKFDYNSVGRLESWTLRKHLKKISIGVGALIIISIVIGLLSTSDNEIKLIVVGGKSNYIDAKGNYISDQWFDNALDFKDGVGPVELKGKWNYIDASGKFLSEQWFDQTHEFHEGVGQVVLNNQWNYIDKDGKYLSGVWFDGASGFCDGVGVVLLNNRYNFIDKNGKYMSDQWFDNMLSFKEGVSIVMLNGKYNYIGLNGKYLSNKWFDKAYGFSDGYGPIALNDKWNYIDKKGNYLSDRWFDAAYTFNDGIGAVVLNNKGNYINKNGDFLSDQWFDSIAQFADGFGPVELNGKKNYINQSGKLLSDEWFDEVYGFLDGAAAVKRNGKFNYIDNSGKLLSDQWFDGTYSFEGGFGPVKLNGKWNYISSKGKFLTDQWYDGTFNFNDGLGAVKLNDKWNYLDKNGNYLSNQWFETAYDFKDGFGSVKLDGKWNLLNKSGHYLLDQWYDKVFGFHDGPGIVEVKGKRAYINKEGKLLSDIWYDSAYNFKDGYGLVVLNGKCNYVNNDGRYLTDQWYDAAGEFSEGVALVQLNGKWNALNTKGQCISQQWFDKISNFENGTAKVELNGKMNSIDTRGRLFYQWMDIEPKDYTQSSEKSRDVLPTSDPQAKLDDKMKETDKHKKDTGIEVQKDGRGQEIKDKSKPDKPEIAILKERYDQGDCSVAYRLGCLYRDRKEKGDNERAFECFKKGASINNSDKPNALYELGECYRSGTGVEKDEKAAIECWRQAAAMGHHKAQIKYDDEVNDLQPD